jgi:hypothetical protein
MLCLSILKNVYNKITLDYIINLLVNIIKITTDFFLVRGMWEVLFSFKGEFVLPV